MIDTTLAKRYAKALVEIALGKDKLDKYGADLSGFTHLIESSRDLREVLVSPVFTKEDKKKIAGDVLSKMTADPMVVNFVKVLIDRKRIDQLQGINAAFADKVDEIRGITRGEIISAEPLTDEDMNQVTEALSKLSGKKVLLQAKVDDFLIGGLYAKVGDMVFDGTIRTQLNQLKESLKG
ncbi:MAG: ATP synthase F1 subunit delta [Desulfomonilaceae bacterium]